MERILNDEIVEEILTVKLPSTNQYQKCSFILPDGKFLKMFEHYEAYRFLVIEQLAPSIPDAEQLLSDLGYVRFSYIGYVTLPTKKLTKAQYDSLEEALIQISKLRDDISVQLYDNPKVYVNYSLDDVPNILKKIKMYYTNKKLLP